jgi:ferredoxin
MSEELVPIFIMGKKYMVPANLTIMKAMEYSGYQLIRGAGCRGGFCGACSTVYRVAGDYRLQIGLACQTVVEPGMFLAQIPFYPAHRADYRLNELEPTFQAVVKTYPELLRCLSCGTCTKVCPQDIDVKQYMADAMRGDITSVATRSFDCIMCGLCVSRCPADEVQPNVAILCRRLYGKYLAPKAAHVEERVMEIEAGKFDDELAALRGLGEDELRQLYNDRDIEPE